jgi:hypothetical protein
MHLLFWVSHDLQDQPPCRPQRAAPSRAVRLLRVTKKMWETRIAGVIAAGSKGTTLRGSGKTCTRLNASPHPWISSCPFSSTMWSRHARGPATHSDPEWTHIAMYSSGKGYFLLLIERHVLCRGPLRCRHACLSKSMRPVDHLIRLHWRRNNVTAMESVYTDTA